MNFLLMEIIFKFTSDELLPAHLKSAEGISWGEEGSIASGWVNSIKISSKEEFIREMEKLGFRHCLDCKDVDLWENNFIFDSLCPKVINFHEKGREKLATSDLVRSHRFVFLVHLIFNNLVNFNCILQFKIVHF